MATQNNGTAERRDYGAVLADFPMGPIGTIRLTVRAAVAPREQTKHKTWSTAVDVAYLNDGKWSADHYSGLNVPVSHIPGLARALMAAWEAAGKPAQSDAALTVYTAETDRTRTATVPTVYCATCKTKVYVGKSGLCSECGVRVTPQDAPVLSSAESAGLGLA